MVALCSAIIWLWDSVLASAVWRIIRHRYSNDMVVCNAQIIVIIKSVRPAGTRCIGFSRAAAFFRFLLCWEIAVDFWPQEISNYGRLTVRKC